MKVSTLTRTMLLLAFTTLLAACGGGGGSGNDSGFNPPGARLSVSPASVSINTNSGVAVTLRATQSGGAAVPDGTPVSATVSPGSLGSISAIGSGEASGTATATTAGGNAVFFFQSGGQPGSGSLNFSMVDPSTPGRTVTASAGLQVNSGPGNDPRIQFQATAATLPANPYWGQGYVPFIGSPYVTEVTITARTASGQPFSGDDAELAVSINPVEVAAFSTLDDGETDDVNEFFVLLGTGPVEVNAGQATVFVHSFEAGTAVLSVSFIDPETGQAVFGQYTINVGAATPALPANVDAGPATSPVYVQGSGGPTFTTFNVRVEDGSGQEVPNPGAGNTRFNNVRIEILGDGIAAGEQLSGINAQGQNVQGTSIDLATSNGIAGATFRAGTRTGTTTIRATADRADNNVDNGIQDPVVGIFTIVIGDGRLFAIDLVVPGTDALFDNQIIDTDADGQDVIIGPDGTYSVTVSAIATDRLGNPVVPGTIINFGLIDEPQSGFPNGGGGFDISGFDGNPQESGTLFTAPTGQFLTAGGGAGPGDTLVLFGEEVTGNRDHEAARTVASVNSQTSLTVSRRFNRNDDTGVSVDSGPVIPYVVGRATDGTIPSSAATDALGVATTRFTYPVAQLGKPVIIWAQGEGEIINNVADTVADVEVYVFFGLAPATLAVSPDPIPGNRTVQVQACVFDANLNPFQGVDVAFQFSGLGGGSGSIDGVSTSGVMSEATDASGCATGTLVTSGVPPQLTSDPIVVFSAVGQSVEIPIVVNVALLTAIPTFVQVPNEGTEVVVALQLLDDQGQGVPNVPISASCTAGLEILAAPGLTNQDGRTGVRIRACGFTAGDTGTCTYVADTGQQATTQFSGGGAGASPPYGGCAGP